MKMNANIDHVMYLPIVQTQWVAIIVHVFQDMKAMDSHVKVTINIISLIILETTCMKFRTKWIIISSKMFFYFFFALKNDVLNTVIYSYYHQYDDNLLTKNDY